VKMFDAGKTTINVLPYGEKTDNMLSRFYLIPECHGQTDRQTDGQMDRIAISITRVSVLTREKNRNDFCSLMCQMTMDLNSDKLISFIASAIHTIVSYSTSVLTRDIDIAILSVRLSVRLSRSGIVSKRLTYHNTSFSIW